MHLTWKIYPVPHTKNARDILSYERWSSWWRHVHGISHKSIHPITHTHKERDILTTRHVLVDASRIRKNIPLLNLVSYRYWFFQCVFHLAYPNPRNVLWGNWDRTHAWTVSWKDKVGHFRLADMSQTHVCESCKCLSTTLYFVIVFWNYSSMRFSRTTAKWDWGGSGQKQT